MGIFAPALTRQSRCRLNLCCSLRAKVESFEFRTRDFVDAATRNYSSSHSESTLGPWRGGGFARPALAREYVWRFGATYYPGGVFWLDAEQDEEGLIRQFHGMIGPLS